MRKPIMCWIGYADGKPYVERIKEFYGGVPHIALFIKRKDARRVFEDVRKVRVTP